VARYTVSGLHGETRRLYCNVGRGSYTHSGKRDTIQLSVKKEHEKLFVLTVFVTTGRLQVQGDYYSEWSSTKLGSRSHEIRGFNRGRKFARFVIVYITMTVATEVADYVATQSRQRDENNYF